MPALHLGVVDVAYAAKDGRPGKTTGDVAQWLEDKYHVLEHFYEAHEQQIADGLAECLEDWLQDRLSGSPANAVSFLPAESAMKTMFVKFIDSQEMDHLGYPGIPTKAALAGVNHRMKHPYAKRGPRPSFRDTGTYENAFWAQVEE